ncbi:MAG: hypothetical protein EBT53_09060 [Betaproteobacteria bacterium]|nr:hypothetical protein [Candidatus Fonsibacter lacus]
MSRWAGAAPARAAAAQPVHKILAALRPAAVGSIRATMLAVGGGCRHANAIDLEHSWDLAHTF